MSQREDHAQKLSTPKTLQRWRELEEQNVDDPEKQEQERSVLGPDGQSGIQRCAPPACLPACLLLLLLLLLPPPSLPPSFAVSRIKLQEPKKNLSGGQAGGKTRAAAAAGAARPTRARISRPPYRRGVFPAPAPLPGARAEGLAGAPLAASFQYGTVGAQAHAPAAAASPFFFSFPRSPPLPSSLPGFLGARATRSLALRHAEPRRRAGDGSPARPPAGLLRPRTLGVPGLRRRSRGSRRKVAPPALWAPERASRSPRPVAAPPCPRGFPREARTCLKFSRAQLGRGAPACPPACLPAAEGWGGGGEARRTPLRKGDVPCIGMGAGRQLAGFRTRDRQTHSVSSALSLSPGSAPLASRARRAMHNLSPVFPGPRETG
uniref:Uncharacterized protein n=1 Tax=Pogona vitticeps TaxID=103695 RepID=A0ABM5FCM5_9SAUR